jgi:hypothetical protein
LEAGKLVNGHFIDDPFLTILEDHTSMENTMDCLQIFCEVSLSKIRWAKAQYYKWNEKDLPLWFAEEGWKWILPNKIFKFLGIPFAFQASPKDIWDVLILQVEKKIDKLIAKPMTLIAKLRICAKALETTHVYFPHVGFHLSMLTRG